MSRRIQDTPFAALLPESIRHDTGIAAAAQALDSTLRGLVLGVPNLLLFSRLDPTPGRLSPPLQRIVDSASAADASAAGAGKVAAGGLNPLSEAELELLAWQFHVDFRDAARNPAELAAMVRDSIPWHRIKGTPASIYAALEMFGISARLEEHTSPHWATYQMELDSATAETVGIAYTVAKAMQPVRCRLGRVFTDAYDFRPIRPTAGPKLGEGWLSLFSGVPVEMPDGETVQVSFGLRHAVETDPFAPSDACVGVGMETGYAVLAPYIDKFTVGVSKIGDEFPRNHCFAINGHFSGLLADPELNGRPWSGPWVGPWLGERIAAGCDRKLPPWRMGYRSSSYSQLVLGEGLPLGDENARLGVSTVTLIDTPGRLGDMRLGKHNPGRRVERIHKFFVEITGHTTPAPVFTAPAPSIPVAVGAETGHTSENLHCHPVGWQGPWAQRPWWPYMAYAAVGSIGLHSELHTVLHTVAQGATRIHDNLFSA